MQTIYNPIHGVLLVTAAQSSDQWTQWIGSLKCKWTELQSLPLNAESTSHPFHKRDRQ